MNGLGVKLRDLIKPVAKKITLRNLTSKRIAIDAFNSLYQFLSTIRQPDGKPLKDFNGNVTSHLSGLYYRTLNLIESDLRPVYVFDGPPHELKLNTIKERREKRDQARKKMEQAQDDLDDTEAKKFAQATSRLTSQMIEESKELLEYMGIPWIEAVHDGEGEAARLINNGNVWASASQDYDSLLFGAKRLIRNLNISRKRKVNNRVVEVDINFYSCEKVLEHLNITQDQLVDVGILVGTDFFKGIFGVGEKTALNLIKKHGSIEQIIKEKVEIHKKPITIDEDLLFRIRGIFSDVKAPADKIKFKWTSPNESGIRELLQEKHNFSKQRIDSSIKRLLGKKSGKIQTSLDKFF